MSAQVIRLWGGAYEKRMRVPTGPLPRDATVIILPVLRPLLPGRKRRVRVRVDPDRAATLLKGIVPTD